MIVISPDTVLNPAALETRVVPRRFFGRAMVWPRGMGRGDFWRFVFEMQWLRYAVALLPFVFAALIWREFTLPIAQAPLLMVIAIGFFELKVLKLDEAARARITGDPAHSEALDRLRFRGQAAMRRIAARHDIAEGALTLVVEQSELARVRPLTFVSVQRAAPTPEVMALGAEDREILQGLFEGIGDERALQRANLAEDVFVREVTVEARSVSAHARLRARLERGGMAEA
ncbi:hypothetical protein [Ovoidimarina sediminis]|uniref:hypothetical protein n=1 Tax=Ovoidimarina sediminis TaxID=3079856 RepID=UPI00290FBD2D|nr:hypothetical protein [Rhodophyticola sp. MJ-SS7]MDU8944042.1 hypothetical protein [Rhodophyticola sp. MJ-SS7]